MATTSSACSAIYHISHYLSLEDRSEMDVFDELIIIKSGVNHFCSDAIVKLGCAYIYPACNPSSGK